MKGTRPAGPSAARPGGGGEGGEGGGDGEALAEGDVAGKGWG